ncbi:MAG: murein L,D-transpeptidase catalytic domain family protein, partial [Gammaproteobacteria bacterium]
LGSLKSSLGVFVTDEPYMGGDGYSLRLKGLEPGVNDNAYRRDVVIHGAWYVDPSVARQYGEMGRSWGCPAVGKELAKPIIDTIKGNTVLFAYYPDQHWLSHSHYLT